MILQQWYGTGNWNHWRERHGLVYRTRLIYSYWCAGDVGIQGHNRNGIYLICQEYHILIYEGLKRALRLVPSISYIHFPIAACARRLLLQSSAPVSI